MGCGASKKNSTATASAPAQTSNEGKNKHKHKHKHDDDKDRHHGATGDAAAHYDEPVAQYYTFDKLVGTGSFAEVFLAHRKSDGQRVAIKAIDEKAANFEPGDLDIEVQVLLTVNHPNIIKLYEVFESADHFYMVLELVDGGELFDHIIERGHYSEATAASIMKQVFSALQHLHENNIVHRDLKPENLLYHQEDDNPRDDIMVKIADFGLSALVAQDHLLTDLCGSPGYVAPEVLRRRKYDASVDMWSAGVILYILLCGSTPFGGRTDEEMFQSIMAAEYSFDGPEWDTISDNAKDLVSHLLDVDPKRRYTTHQALAHPWITEEAPDIHLFDLVSSMTSWRAEAKQMVHAKLLKWASSARAVVRSREASVSQAAPVGRRSRDSLASSDRSPDARPHRRRRRRRGASRSSSGQYN